MYKAILFFACAMCIFVTSRLVSAQENIDAPRSLKVYQVTIGLEPIPAASPSAASASETKACLQAYDRRLLEALRSPTYSERAVECTGCNLLTDPMAQVLQLNYRFFRDHDEHFQHFTRAWNYVQHERNTETGDVGYPQCDFVMKAILPAEPACPTLPPPSICYKNTLCGNGYNPSGCSKNNPQLSGTAGQCKSCLP